VGNGKKENVMKMKLKIIILIYFLVFSFGCCMESPGKFQEGEIVALKSNPAIRGMVIKKEKPFLYSGWYTVRFGVKAGEFRECELVKM
jgi:hypothetical protein